MDKEQEIIIMFYKFTENLYLLKNKLTGI